MFQSNFLDKSPKIHTNNQTPELNGQYQEQNQFSDKMSQKLHTPWGSTILPISRPLNPGLWMSEIGVE